MSGHQSITRTLIAAAGALLMSTVAIGTAVVPAHVPAVSQPASNV